MTFSTCAKYYAKCWRSHRLKFQPQGANSIRQVRQVNKHVAHKMVECYNKVGIKVSWKQGEEQGRKKTTEDRKKLQRQSAP